MYKPWDMCVGVFVDVFFLYDMSVRGFVGVCVLLGVCEGVCGCVCFM